MSFNALCFIYSVGFIVQSYSNPLAVSPVLLFIFPLTCCISTELALWELPYKNHHRVFPRSKHFGSQKHVSWM